MLANKIFVLLILVITNTWAADYYARPDSKHSTLRNGKSYATAWGLSDIDWTKLVAGDTLHLCGKFNKTLSLGGNLQVWGGVKGNNIIITGACIEEAGSIQDVSGSAIEIVRRDYVTIQDLIINNISKTGIVAYGRGGQSTPEANRDLLIKNINIKNTGGSGIIISCLNGYPTYAPQTGILIEDVTITNAAHHGIYASCYQSGTIIRRAHVSGSATGGNYWGIDVSSRFIHYSGQDWEQISRAIYKIGMAKISRHWNGKPGWETVSQLINTSLRPYHLTKEPECIDAKSCIETLGLFSYNQVGSDIYINIGSNPNNNGIAFVTAIFGSIIVEDSYVTQTSNNGGKTDGVGIGADLGTSGVIFRRNTSEKNQGSGFELSGADDALMVDNVAIQNGKWGFIIHMSRGTGVKILRNKALNNGTWQYYTTRNLNSAVTISDNYAEGGTECLHLSETPSIHLENNTCIKPSISIPGLIDELK